MKYSLHSPFTRPRPFVWSLFTLACLTVALLPAPLAVWAKNVNPATARDLPAGFSYLSEVAPEIVQDVRYHGKYNFVGERIDGYKAPVIIMSTAAAKALQKAQAALKAKGLGLKVFDAYRPMMAVQHFVRWAKKTDDTRMKPDFYPREKKQLLFKRGYISSKSAHSRGSTIDLTVIRLDSGKELDMGTPFDFLDEASGVNAGQLTKEQQANRAILKKTMIDAGFRPYSKEWWHFTLKNEPFPKQQFNFPVQ